MSIWCEWGIFVYESKGHLAWQKFLMLVWLQPFCGRTLICKGCSLQWLSGMVWNGYMYVFFFIYRNMVCMLCFNFLLGLEFTFLCMVMIYDNDFETNESKILTKVISETHHACVDCTVPYVHIWYNLRRLAFQSMSKIFCIESRMTIILICFSSCNCRACYSTSSLLVPMTIGMCSFYKIWSRTELRKKMWP